MNEEMQQLSAEQYARDFSFHPVTQGVFSRGENALKTALDVRKFEIELYWKRATYFWAFLALTLGAYFTVFLSKIDLVDAVDGTGKPMKIPDNSQLMQRHQALLLLSCLGLVFSVCWYLVNRASKYWQENWEKHVDLLESASQGPPYRTVLHNEKMHWWNLLGAFSYSVSKLNQTLSLFVTGLFCILFVRTVYNYYPLMHPLGFPIAVIIVTFIALLTLIFGCTTGKTNSGLTAWRRETGITFHEMSDQQNSSHSGQTHKHNPNSR